MDSKNLDKALAQIHKQFGEDSIMKMGSSGLHIESIPTGSILLDRALGIGGIPKGRIIEVYGPESTGKSTLALHMLVEAQKLGPIAFIDAEHALDIEYAKKIGINVDELLISQPSCGEEALEIVDTLVRSNVCSLIVVDSVAALTPRAEIEGEMGEAHMGLQARLMSQALRKLTGVISKSNCSVLFTNQLRSKIGIVYGSPEVTTGGNALKFYATIRIDIRKKEKIEQNNEIVGNKIHVKIVKNKVAPPFKEFDTELIFGKGINRSAEVLELLMEAKIVERAGAWFKYNNESYQGREKIIEHIANNYDAILALIT